MRITLIVCAVSRKKESVYHLFIAKAKVAPRYVFLEELQQNIHLTNNCFSFLFFTSFICKWIGEKIATFYKPFNKQTKILRAYSNIFHIVAFFLKSTSDQQFLSEIFKQFLFFPLLFLPKCFIYYRIKDRNKMKKK